MSAVMYHTVVGDVYRLKALVLPLLVPVAVVGFGGFVVDVNTVEGEVGDGLTQCVLGIQVLLYVAFQSVLGFLECLISRIASHGSEQVA